MEETRFDFSLSNEEMHMLSSLLMDAYDASEVPENMDDYERFHSRLRVFCEKNDPEFMDAVRKYGLSYGPLGGGTASSFGEG